MYDPHPFEVRVSERPLNKAAVAHAMTREGLRPILPSFRICSKGCAKIPH
jgi:hypothetical protein